MAAPFLLPHTCWEQMVQGLMGKAAPPSLHMESLLLPNVELFWETAVAQLPAQHPRTQGQLQANPTLGAPTDPGESAGEVSSMVWGAGGELGSDRSSQQLPSRGEERQRGSMWAQGDGAVPGMLTAVLQGAAPCRGFAQLDGAGYICSSFQWQQQMPPWLQELRIAVFPGKECCQEEYFGYSL